MTPCDAILWLESGTTGRRFPVAQFGGDADMATDGWVSLTSICGNEVVVAMMTAEEFSATAQDAAAYSKVECRINASLHRDDLRVCWLDSVTDQDRGLAGHSFQGFRRASRPANILYRDILSPGALAKVVAKVSLSAFESEGGKLVAFEP